MREEIDSLTNEKCETFIEECQEKLNLKGKEETLFSIVGGKSTAERTASRILAFFFDTNRKHGMKDLFIKSFIDAAGDNYKKDFPHDFYVEKEVYTKHEKKIDILLLNPQCNIVIENKIYADLYNDLEEYYDTAKSRKCGSPKKVKGYVLSLFDMQDSIEEQNVEDMFTCVTYKKFLDTLEENYKSYTISDDPKNFVLYKYFVLYKDFIENMRSLEEKIMSNLDQEFWTKYKDIYEELEKQRVTILKGKAQNLKNILACTFKKNAKFKIIEEKDISIWNRDNLIKTDCKEENAYQVSVYFNYKSEKNNCTIQPNIVISLLKGTRIFIDSQKKFEVEELLKELKDGNKGCWHDEQFFLYKDSDKQDIQFDNCNEKEISNFIIDFLTDY